MLVNPNNPNTKSVTGDAQTAAKTLGKKLVVVKAATELDFDTAFSNLIREKVDSLLVETDPFLLDRREQIVCACGTTHASRDLPIS
jgi:putative ABC transport system substrate-binding protein